MSILINRLLLVLIFLQVASCKSMSQREKDILEYPETKIITYESALVTLDSYTTDGILYHKKYKKYLIGLARFLSEEKKYSIRGNSIGFYFDRKENLKSKLYFGVDINFKLDSDKFQFSYNNILKDFLNDSLDDILYIVFSCKTIFSEKDVLGMVIGFIWEREGIREMANIWIDKRDVLMYEKGMLTLKEIIERNVLTNTHGKIIRLR